MDITVSKNEFSNALSKLQSITSYKSTLPILSTILLSAEESTLKLFATNLNVGINCSIPASIKESGKIAAPAKRLNEIIREFPEETIHLSTTENNSIHIKSKTCKFRISGMLASDFPKEPAIETDLELKMVSTVLYSMINQVIASASTDEARALFNGILFEITDNILTLVATDAQRLSIIKHTLDSSVSSNFRAVVPLNTISELLKLRIDGEPLALKLSSTHLVLEIQKYKFFSRLIEGEFPIYNNLIPEHGLSKISVPKVTLLAALKRATLLLTPDSHLMKMTFGNNKIILSKTTPDVGDSEEEILISYNGDIIEVGFSPLYLIDAISPLKSDNAILEVNTCAERPQPSVVREGTYLSLVLPMRIK